jgi:hypothetical protein
MGNRVPKRHQIPKCGLSHSEEEEGRARREKGKKGEKKVEREHLEGCSQWLSEVSSILFGGLYSLLQFSAFLTKYYKH